MMRNEVAELIAKCERQIAALASDARANRRLVAAAETAQRLVKLQLARFEAAAGCARFIDDVLQKQKETLH